MKINFQTLKIDFQALKITFMSCCEKFCLAMIEVLRRSVHGNGIWRSFRVHEGTRGNDKEKNLGFPLVFRTLIRIFARILQKCAKKRDLVTPPYI